MIYLGVGWRAPLKSQIVKNKQHPYTGVCSENCDQILVIFMFIYVHIIYTHMAKTNSGTSFLDLFLNFFATRSSCFNHYDWTILQLARVCYMTFHFLLYAHLVIILKENLHPVCYMEIIFFFFSQISFLCALDLAVPTLSPISNLILLFILFRALESRSLKNPFFLMLLSLINTE